jgi:hypothetical protein
MAFTVYLLPAYPPTICSAQPSAVSPPYTHSGHKVHIEHHSARAPTPLPQAIVPSPPDQRDVGHTRLRLRVWGSPNSDDWRKSLALCLLCDSGFLLSDFFLFHIILLLVLADTHTVNNWPWSVSNMKIHI